MATNPYAPPTAEVADVPAVSSDVPWFPVSVSKLLLMSVCTMALYQVYWLYQHWSRVKRREDDSIWPIPRAIFGIFFCYQLFAKIRDDSEARGTGSLAAGPLAAAWIIASLLWRLPDPWWLLAMSTSIFILPVQAHANAVNAAVVPGHDANTRFSVWNWIAVVLGGALLVLALIGTFAGE